MPSRFARIIAICLIVLGASPFTAPFSTCDVGALQDHGRSMPAGTAEQLWLKAPTDPDPTPILVAACALMTPLIAVVPAGPIASVVRIAVQQSSHPILRI